MSTAVLYLSICVAGYLCAIPLRKYKSKLAWFGTAQLVSVLCVVFIMGVRVGSNQQVIRDLGTYGVIALVFTIVVVVCSILAVHLARRIVGLDRYGLAVSRADAQAGAAGDADGATANVAAGDGTDGTFAQSEIDAQAAADVAEANADAGAEKSRSVDKMTIFILISVTIGILSGYFYFYKNFSFEQIVSASSLGITVILCILLAFVGLDLGLEGQVIANIKKVGIKILVIPLAVAVGTVVGSIICSLFLPLAVNESTAIGTGFAWYSLGAAIIMDAGYEAAGAISFMHNLMRELFAIVFVPIIAKRFGYVEALGIPASVGMDVCLPIVEQSTNGTTTVYSFITGFMLSMSVPFLVPFFLAL